MSPSLWAFAATAFLAVVMLFWGLSALWRSRWGGQHQALQQRWQSLVRRPTTQPPGEVNTRLHRIWHALPGTAAWTRLVQHTGWPVAPAPALLLALAWPLCVGVWGRVLGWGNAWIALATAMGLAAPLWWGLHAWQQQIVRIDAQLPDVLDLVARAMQAGHAFTSALQMAADDAKPPLSAHLHQVFDEIHFGLDLRQAMNGLAVRIDSDDVRFFVTSVLVQHDTGGNLAEILKNTATLIRERQKLRGVIRVLSGEGRVSAWILSLLPFGLAAVLHLVNPEFMSTLWTVPQGLQMLYASLMLMLAGIFWMWRLIDIRI